MNTPKAANDKDWIFVASTKAEIVPNAFLPGTPNHSNDRVSSSDDLILSIDEKSGYTFSTFQWQESDIPSKIIQDDLGRIHFKIPGVPEICFLPKHNASIVYKDLLDVAKQWIGDDFSEDKLINVKFSQLQDNGAAQLSFVYDGGKYSGPFPLSHSESKDPLEQVEEWNTEASSIAAKTNRQALRLVDASINDSNLDLDISYFEGDLNESEFNRSAND